MVHGTAMEPRLIAWINYAYLLAIMAAIVAILTTAMVLQYVYGEIPCPLCLLQRVALFGICFGIMRNFQLGVSSRNTGISLLFTVFLLVVAARQTLLDIYPRPGHAYIGSAVLGLHMPVWSVVIALLLLLAYALKLIAVGSDEAVRAIPAKTFPMLARAQALLGAFVIALCLINLGSVVLQCGLGQCHTTGYRLLQ